MLPLERLRQSRIANRIADGARVAQGVGVPLLLADACTASGHVPVAAVGSVVILAGEIGLEILATQQRRRAEQLAHPPADH